MTLADDDEPTLQPSHYLLMPPPFQNKLSNAFGKGGCAYCGGRRAVWRLVGAYSLSTISSCLLLLHVAINASPDGAKRVDALVNPPSGV